jgi:hypothetical protein
MPIPAPILFGVPLVGLAALLWWEWSKSQSSSSSTTKATGPSSAATGPSSAPGKIVFKAPQGIGPISPPAAAAGSSPVILQAAQQALAGVPGAMPNDPASHQLIVATLHQLIASPTVQQLIAAMTALQQNGTSVAMAAYGILSRANQIVSS